MCDSYRSDSFLYGDALARFTGVDLVVDERVPDDLLVLAPGDPEHIRRVNQKTFDRLAKSVRDE